MKLMHTSDWHVGKVLKGQNRVAEHVAVLAQLVEIARAERPDLVIVAGDLYDTAAPTPDSTRLVTRALSALRATGAQVVAIGGNHDNGPALDALRPWAEAAGVALRGTVRDSPAEHIVDGSTASGERWRVVALPFLSQRYAVRAVEMYELTAAEATQTYADHLGRLLGRLTEGFDEPDRVHLVAAHLTVVGAQTGGGEREAHTVLGYAVPATVFPGNAHYVALGHLHRSQQVIGPCPIRYSGSPLPIDFGETENVPSVTIVEVGARTAARVREVPITAATPLRTVRGTLAELAAMSPPDAWLRVYVRETPRAGLREEVQELLPRALEVRIDPELLAATAAANRGAQRAGRSPRDLFADYLTSRGQGEDGVRELFDELYEEVESA
ncbi:exonuclease SbcCD subunit D [Micromonospora sp. NPDC049559]|uniref:exonuclease SbcCD subunit D n=1 Tax=Micromonospora sp. NPDC049559 TaxID=3155923 RepID=UPI0034128B4D